jgi:uncharacterized protein (DUF305 family)
MTVERSPLRRAAVLAALPVVVMLGAAACGDGPSDRPAASHGHASPAASAAADGARQHNDQDVAFAKGMIPHHRQAVAMSDLAAERAGSREVEELAAKIKAAQDPEIAAMSAWLTAWGEEVPADDAHGAHAHHDMPGMMSREDMDGLAKLSGAAFDAEFLKMMIAHHEGAVTMAEEEKARGAYGPAKKMAEDIIAGQSDEISQMKKLLAG